MSRMATVNRALGMMKNTRPSLQATLTCLITMIMRTSQAPRISISATYSITIWIKCHFSSPKIVSIIQSQGILAQVIQKLCLKGLKKEISTTTLSRKLALSL